MKLLKLSFKHVGLLLLLLLAILISGLLLNETGRRKDMASPTVSNLVLNLNKQVLIQNYAYSPSKSPEKVMVDFAGGGFQFDEAIMSYFFHFYSVPKSFELSEPQYKQAIAEKSSLPILMVNPQLCEFDSQIVMDKLTDHELIRIEESYGYKKTAVKDISQYEYPYISRVFYTNHNDINYINLGQAVDSGYVYNADDEEYRISNRLCNLENSRQIQVFQSSIDYSELVHMLSDNPLVVFDLNLLPPFFVDYYTEEAIFDFEINQPFVVDDVSFEYIFISETSMSVPLMRIHGKVVQTEEFLPVSFWVWPW